MAILNIVDQAAWVAVRIVGLIQVLIGNFILIFYQPNPCKKDEYDDFNLIHSMIFGGWMLFHSHKPEDLPRPISERALLVGRFGLGVFLIVTITGVIRGIF